MNPQFVEKYPQSFYYGNSAEDLAILSIINTFGTNPCDCVRTSKDIDKYCHTDIIWKAPKGLCTIDVKAAREIKRSSPKMIEKYGVQKRYDGTWFELIGNTGHPGSATCQVEQLKKYGITDARNEFDYVMCESLYYFFFFRRDELSKRLFEIIKDKPLYFENLCMENVPYTRSKWNHNDLSVFVKYETIKDLLKFGLPKYNKPI